MTARTTVRRVATALVLPAALAASLVAGSSAQAATNSYTMKDVAKHKTAANCWTVVGGNVYDLTKWLPKHPGGPQMIAAMCGKDSTAGFTGAHGTSAAAKKALKGYKIGVVKK